MNNTKWFKSILFLLIIGFSTSCSDSNPYDERIKLNDSKSQHEFIKRLAQSGLKYRVDEDGNVEYRSQDKDDVFEIAFNSKEQSVPAPDSTLVWKITQDHARRIVLDRYPAILNNANMFGPVAAKLETRIEGFAQANKEVWHIRIHCKKGGPHALFFIHPDTGHLFEIQAPNQAGSVKCG